MNESFHELPPHSFDALIGGRPSDETIAEENARLRQDVQRMAENQQEVMQLLNCKAPERIVHDLRNVLNELNLYRSLVETQA